MIDEEEDEDERAARTARYNRRRGKKNKSDDLDEWGARPKISNRRPRVKINLANYDLEELDELEDWLDEHDDTK